MKKNKLKKNLGLTILFVFLAIQGFSNWFIFTQRFTADPCVIVYNGRVYIYMSHDLDTQHDYSMDGYTCISSDDLINWTDHGEVLMASSIPYISAAGKQIFWAPEAVYRDGKFYLYFCTPNYGNDPLTSGTGVCVSNSPIGLFTDPRGSLLITGHRVDCSVLIDDDGQTYIYWPNGLTKKLSSNMYEYSDSQDYNVWNNDAHEATYVRKINSKYYYMYMTFNDQELWACTQNNASPGGCPNGDADYFHRYNFLASPTGPVVEPEGIFGRTMTWPVFGDNTQPAIFQFQGNYYSLYHGKWLSRLRNQDLGYQRNVGLDRIYFNPDGTIIPQTLTKEGLCQVKYLNPFIQQEAETMAGENGIETESTQDVGGGRDVGQIDNGDWIRVAGADFGNGATSINMRLASPIGSGKIEIHLDSVKGALTGTIIVPNTGGWQTWQTVTQNISTVTGIHDIYFTFTTPGFNINWWQFNGGAPTGTIPPQVVKTITIKSHANNKYISAVSTTAPLVASASSISINEKFQLFDNEDGTYSLYSIGQGKWVTADNAGVQPLIANKDAISTLERFHLLHSPDGSYCLFAEANKKFVTAPNSGNNPLIANVDTAWKNPNRDISRFWIDYTATQIPFCTDQTINFTPIEKKKYTDTPFTITATASSGLEVTYEIISGPATVKGDTISLTGLPGTVAVRASQAGNQKYCPVSAQQIFSISGKEPDNGIGLNGTYFSNTTLTGTPCSSRIDTTINFDWGTGSLTNTGCTSYSDNFSIRWTGYILPQYSETFTFFIGSDDGTKLYINDQLLIDNWKIQAYTEKSGTLNLIAGKSYKITIEYYEATGDASVKFFWQSTSVAKEIIPKSQLFPTDPLGISAFQNSSENNIEIYPNPAKDELLIKYLSSKAKGNSEITITNTMGQVVFNYAFELFPYASQTIDISGLQRGIYFIKIMNDEKIITKKIIKQ